MVKRFLNGLPVMAQEVLYLTATPVVRKSVLLVMPPIASKALSVPELVFCLMVANAQWLVMWQSKIAWKI
jgi:hypothetical protein